MRKSYTHLLFSYLFFVANFIAAQTDGTLDRSFVPEMAANDNVLALVPQPDGKVLVGGDFREYNGIERDCIARLNADGSLDTSFNPGTMSVWPSEKPSVHDVALQPDGKILIAGAFRQYNGTDRRCIARLNADGSLDSSFDPGAAATSVSASITASLVRAIALQPDGKILIAGHFRKYNGADRSCIARLNTDGSLDSSFVPETGINEYGTLFSVVLQPDGKILIGGSFQIYDNIWRRNIARLNPDGSTDLSFDPGTGPDGVIQAVALQPDGKILVGGNFTHYNFIAVKNLARLNADGSFDGYFVSGIALSYFVCSIIFQATDHKILIGGQFSRYSGIGPNNIARLRADGSIDTAFDPGTETNGTVRVVAPSIAADGKVLIGGEFTKYNGAGRNRIARLNGNGSLDDSFASLAGVNGAINAIVLQPDGRILIGGTFKECNGTGRSNIARLKSDGSIDTSFGTWMGVEGERWSTKVGVIALQPDGKIVIGGDFSKCNGINRNSIARLHADGSLDHSFDPGAGVYGYVNSIAIQPDGKIFIGGAFTEYNGESTRHIARLNADGSLDSSFDPGYGAFLGGQYNPVRAIALQHDGKVLVGGEFSYYNWISQKSIVRLNADGSLDTSFNPGRGAEDGYFGTSVNAIVIQPDGKILIGGDFSKYNGVNRTRIARLYADASLDSSFDAGTSCAVVEAIVLQPDGKLLVGGSDLDFFNTFYNAKGIIRLNTDGSMDSHFEPGTGTGVSTMDIHGEPSVSAIVLQPDGKILVGGYFHKRNNVERRAVMRLHGSAAVGIQTPAPLYDIVAYPNPAHTVLNLQLSSLLPHAAAQLYDMNGRVVKVTRIEGLQTAIPIADLPCGMYLVKLSGDKGFGTVRFLKE